MPTFGIGCTLGLAGFSSFIPSGSQGDGVRGKAGGTHLRGIMSPLVRRALVGLLSSVGSEARAQTPAGQSAPAFEFSEPLRPGDVLHLRIWREPDLPVDESGHVVLPRLGPVSVMAMSRDSLRRSLLTAYQTYLKNPSIEVILTVSALAVVALRIALQ